jgi:hypothetical protein
MPRRTPPHAYTPSGRTILGTGVGGWTPSSTTTAPRVRRGASGSLNTPCFGDACPLFSIVSPSFLPPFCPPLCVQSFVVLTVSSLARFRSYAEPCERWPQDADEVHALTTSCSITTSCSLSITRPSQSRQQRKQHNNTALQKPYHLHNTTTMTTLPPQVSSPPGVRCADACVRLFAALFLFQPPHTQEQLVKQA